MVEIASPLPKHEPSEVLYYFAWDHSGAFREVSADQALSNGFRKYCRILFDGATLRYRLFVPKTAGKQNVEFFNRKMTQWLKDRFGGQVRDNKGRVSNFNIDERGRFIDDAHLGKRRPMLEVRNQ